MNKKNNFYNTGIFLCLSLVSCVGNISNSNIQTKQDINQSQLKKFQVQTFYTDDIKYSKAITEGSPFSTTQFTANIDDNGVVGGQIIARNTINPRYDSKMHYYRIGREAGDTQDYIISYDFPSDSRLETCFYTDCGLKDIKYLGGNYFGKYWDQQQTGEKTAISQDGVNTSFTSKMIDINTISPDGRKYAEMKSYAQAVYVDLYNAIFPDFSPTRLIASNLPGMYGYSISKINDSRELVINFSKGNKSYPQGALKVNGIQLVVSSLASADYDDEELQMQVLSNDSQYIYGFAIDHSFSSPRLYALVLYKKGSGLKYLYNIPTGIQADIQLKQVTNDGDLYIASGNNSYIYSTLQNKYFNLDTIINYIGVGYINPRVEFSPNGKFMIITGYLEEGMPIKGKLITKIRFDEGLDIFLQQNITPLSISK